MTLEIVKYGDPVLRAKGRPVKQIDGEVRDLANAMLATMRAANGVGLAAQQVGVPLQLAVIDVANIEDRPSTLEIGGKVQNLREWMPLVLMNPELTLGGDTELGPEGCLSFPEITADIERAFTVEVRTQLLDGRRVQFTATGLLARALQHEVDHLNGVLFIDRMSSAMRASLSGRLKRMQKEYAEVR
jgi:peptide deformylase